MGNFVNFTKTTHQIWSFHVTLTSNFENLYLWPDSVLNFRKNYVTKFGGNRHNNKKVTGKKTNLGVENIPSAYRVKAENTEFYESS